MIDKMVVNKRLMFFTDCVNEEFDNKNVLINKYFIISIKLW